MAQAEIGSRKRRMPKSLRHAFMSSAVLLVLLVGAGAAYTWWAGQQTPSTTTTALTVARPEPVIKPPVVAPNAAESAAVEALTDPVAPGSNASITVKSNPGSTCTISVIYGTVASKDSGLLSKKTDAYGTVSWTWTIEKTVPLGKWPVKVTCAYNTHTAVVQADLNVSEVPTT